MLKCLVVMIASVFDLHSLSFCDLHTVLRGLYLHGSSLDWLRRRTFAIRMGRLPCLFGVASLLLVRTPEAVFSPARLWLVAWWLLVDVTHRALCTLGAVFRLVPGHATVGIFPFGFCTSATCLFPGTLASPG